MEKKTKYNGVEDMIYRFQITYVEIIDILDLKYIPTTTVGYTKPLGMYEVIDII